MNDSMLNVILEAVNGLGMRIDNLEREIKEMRTELNARIDQVEASLNARIDKAEARIDQVEASLNARIDQVEASLNARIDQVETSLNKKIDDAYNKLYQSQASLADALGRATRAADKEILKNKEEHEQFKQALGMKNFKVL